MVKSLIVISSTVRSDTKIIHNFVNVIILALLTGHSIVGFGERNEEFNHNEKTIFKSRYSSNDCSFWI